MRLHECRCPHCALSIAEIEERLTGLESAFRDELREHQVGTGTERIVVESNRDGRAWEPAIEGE